MPHQTQPKQTTFQFILDTQCFPPAFPVTIHFPQGPIASLPILLTEKQSGLACVGLDFRIALALTLDLAEVQVVESVGENRKENENWTRARAG